jgi:tetratricopeptide (TPR) repeat protein
MEEQWLRRLSLDSKLDRISRLLSVAELSQLLGVRRDQLRAWIRAGFITPVRQFSGVTFFGFREASRVRQLCELAGRGVTTEQIRQSLEQLRCWMPEADRLLSLLERDGRLLVRFRDELLAEPSGQLCWEFSDDTCVVVTLEQSCPTAADWFDRAWDHEQAGRLSEAAHAYRRALQIGAPNAQICINLGNVLYALGYREAAAERFCQAVELDARLAEAWNNLGNVLAELGRCHEAANAYEQALAANPTYAEAHYNFADLLSQTDRPDDAANHWRQYLQLESIGPWSDYARRQLASL